MPKNNKPKVTFLFSHEYEDTWRDGLWAAIELLKKDFDIEKINLKTAEPHKITTDFMLGWGAFGSPVDNLLSSIDDVPKGLCIGGTAVSPTSQKAYSVLFYETPWYEQLIEDHPNKIHAFGVNTEIYRPKPQTPKIWDHTSVGAFALWKRQVKMIDKTGNRLVVGEIQKGNLSESLNILANLAIEGVAVSDMVDPETLAKIYNASKCVFLPADINGGGERSVWEAMSCGIPVEICDDNPKLQSLIDMGVRDELWYSQQLRKGILSCL